MPESAEDRARSLLLTDHVQTGDALRELGEKIKKGCKVQFDEKQIAEMAEGIRHMPPPLKSPLRSGRLVLWLIVLALITLIFIEALYFRR